MKVLKNKRKGNTVSLEIEASTDIINGAFEKAFRRLSKAAKVPGFRKGKVPRKVFEKHYGKGVLVQEGIPDAVNDAYAKAVEELNLEVVDFPKNVDIGDYKENAGLKFTCEVDVKPDVKLGKYKGIKVEKEPDTADDKVIEDHINQLRENAAEYNDVDRASQDGDIVRFDLEAKADGTEIDIWTRKNLGVKIGLKNFGEDFDKEITGLKKDDKKAFSITYPADFQEAKVAGKKVEFSLNMIEVREKALPELNDEFAKTVSEHETYDALKASVEETYSKQIRENSENKLKEDIITAIIEDSKMDIPEGMIDREVEQDVKSYEENIKRSGSNLQQYLQMVGQTEEAFKEQLKGNAKKRIQSELVIEAITEKEKIEATDDDIRAEVKKMLPHLKDDKELDDHMAKINPEGLKRMVAQRKTVDFLVESAKIKDKKKK